MGFDDSKRDYVGVCVERSLRSFVLMYRGVEPAVILEKHAKEFLVSAYIAAYEIREPDLVIDKIEEIMSETVYGTDTIKPLSGGELVKALWSLEQMSDYLGAAQSIGGKEQYDADSKALEKAEETVDKIKKSLAGKKKVTVERGNSTPLEGVSDIEIELVDGTVIQDGTNIKVKGRGVVKEIQKATPKKRVL